MKLIQEHKQSAAGITLAKSFDLITTGCRGTVALRDSLLRG